MSKKGSKPFFDDDFDTVASPLDTGGVVIIEQAQMKEGDSIRPTDCLLVTSVALGENAKGALALVVMAQGPNGETVRSMIEFDVFTPIYNKIASHVRNIRDAQQ